MLQPLREQQETDTSSRLWAEDRLYWDTVMQSLSTSGWVWVRGSLHSPRHGKVQGPSGSAVRSKRRQDQKEDGRYSYSKRKLRQGLTAPGLDLTWPMGKVWGNPRCSWSRTLQPLMPSGTLHNWSCWSLTWVCAQMNDLSVAWVVACTAGNWEYIPEAYLEPYTIVGVVMRLLRF